MNDFVPASALLLSTRLCLNLIIIIIIASTMLAFLRARVKIYASLIEYGVARKIKIREV